MERPDDQGKEAQPPFYQRKEFLPLAVFAGVLLFLLVSTAVSGPPPVIDIVTQEDNLSYEIVTIEGNNFGPPESGGQVRIGDLALTPSNFLKWSNDKIIVSIPREISSGIIYVVTKNGKCKGDIYINPDEIPRLTSLRGPIINSVSPAQTSPGRVIVIKGERFGSERGGQAVSFSSSTPDDKRPGDKNPAGSLVSASDRDYDYVSWSDNEIRVRVPDSARTGMVVVQTEAGLSNPKYITVISPVGRKEYGKKTGYVLCSSIDVIVLSAAPPNSLSFMIPEPAACPEQRNRETKLLTQVARPSRTPGIVVVTLSDLVDNQTERINLEFSLDRYSFLTEIDPSLVTQDYETEEPFYKVFTGDSLFVRPSAPALLSFLRAATGTERNPYLKARNIYQAIIREFSPLQTPDNARNPDWYQLLAQKTGDSFVYADLFTTLVRKAGVPARLVAGYVLNDTGALRRHYWAEFYLLDFGWVPVDPYLGDGASSSNAPPAVNAETYYFGSLDDRHIALAKGSAEFDKISSNTTVTFREAVPGLQSFHEEAGGSLEHYRVTWNNPTVTFK